MADVTDFLSIFHIIAFDFSFKRVTLCDIMVLLPQGLICTPTAFFGAADAIINKTLRRSI